jgi:hypothetical protein
LLLSLSLLLLLCVVCLFVNCLIIPNRTTVVALVIAAAAAVSQSVGQSVSQLVGLTVLATSGCC